MKMIPRELVVQIYRWSDSIQEFRQSDVFHFYIEQLLAIYIYVHISSFTNVAKLKVHDIYIGFIVFVPMFFSFELI